MSTLKADNLSNLAGSQSTSMLDVINGSAKAWVNFNGTGTVAIRAAYNVSSITDGGVGVYTVNFTNAMPDTNFAVLGTAFGASNGYLQGSGGGLIDSTTSVLVAAITNANTVFDALNVSVAIHR